MTITTQQWIDTGHTRAELDRLLTNQQMIRLRRGVYVNAAPVSKRELHRSRLAAALPALGSKTYFAHASAAVLHGLPLLPRRLDEIVAVRTGGGHGTITPTLHARIAHLEEGETDVVDGLPVTSYARTVADLVRRLPFPEAVMVADAALAHGMDRAELLTMTAKGRGCRMAGRALLFADARAESPGESLSRVRMDAAGIPSPDLQRVLHDAQGNFLARVDFCWEEFGVVGEFDGAWKYGALVPNGRSAAAVIMDEKQREQLLVDANWLVIRWVWADLWNHGFEARLRRAIEARRVLRH